MSDVIDFNQMKADTRFRFRDFEMVLAEMPLWNWGRPFDVGANREPMQDVSLMLHFLTVPKEIAAPKKSSWSKRMGLRKAAK